MKNIEIKCTKGVITIYLDNEFYCTCDSWKEVREELKTIEEENR